MLAVLVLGFVLRHWCDYSLYAGAMLNFVAPTIQAFVQVQALIEEKGKKE